MKDLRLFGGLFGLIGIGLLVGAGFAHRHTEAFIEQAVTGEGEVIEMVARDSSDDDGGPTYAPVVRFRTTEGWERTFTSDSSSNPPSFHVGERVAVLYHPERPDEASIDTFWQLRGVTVFLALLGLPFLGVGVGVSLHAWRQHNRSTTTVGRP